jgi:tetratricopeptide (TPR) repeat protein
VEEQARGILHVSFEKEGITMAQTIMKYNPAFLKPDELVASFVVRKGELETIMRIIKENTTKSNQHVLVVGPRGIGKTTLLLRAAEEVRRTKDLNDKWYPLVFSEESYSVSTCGEFWLESLLHLAHQTKNDQWQKTYDELREEKDEKRLMERALAQLMDFADKEGKKIILVVENLNMLLGDQMTDDEGWALRHTLLNEPRVMLLASATSRFEQVNVEGKPMFELFRFLELKPLNEAECRELWAWVTGNKPDDARVRPLEILTGGNPRLMAIVSNFAAKVSLKNLMNDLMQLVDEHTEYFKSHLDNLPSVERKVYIALAEIWDPATARQVGESARLDVNKTSALLARLIERGAVIEANGKGKAKLYQVAERMYNIYYLMRKRGDTSQRVRAVVNFMTSFYSSEELVGIIKSIAEEACQLAPPKRGDHYVTYREVVNKIKDIPLAHRIIKITPHAFFEAPDTPTSLKELFGKFGRLEVLGHLNTLFEKRESICNDQEELEKERKYFLAFAHDHPKEPDGLIAMGAFLAYFMGKIEEAKNLYQEAIQINSNNIFAWKILGFLLAQQNNRHKEKEVVWRKVIEIDPKDIDGLENLGTVLIETEKLEEAEKTLQMALKLKRNSANIYYNLGYIYLSKKQIGESEQYLKKAIKYDSEHIQALCQLLVILLNIDSRREEGLKIWTDFVKNPEIAQKKVNLAMGLFIAMAGIGFEREALQILTESEWAEALEPVVVALRLMQGEDVKAAAEIMEVAKDVVKRIEETKKQIENTKKSEVKK